MAAGRHVNSKRRNADAEMSAMTYSSMLPAERRMTLSHQKYSKTPEPRQPMRGRAGERREIDVLRCALKQYDVSNKARHKDVQAPLADSIIPAAKRGARVRCVARVRVWRDGAYLF